MRPNEPYQHRKHIKGGDLVTRMARKPLSTFPRALVRVSGKSQHRQHRPHIAPEPLVRPRVVFRTFTLQRPLRCGSTTTAPRLPVKRFGFAQGCDRFSALDSSTTERSPTPNGMFMKVCGRLLSENTSFNSGTLFSAVEKTSTEKRSHLCAKPKRFTVRP